MEMRTVNIIRTAKPFQQYLTSLPETDFKVNIISLCQAEKSFIEAIRLEERSTFVIDINAVDVINSFLEIAHQNYPVSENVRIVVVSDLQTWSNTLPVAYANNITGGFRRRKPAAGALEKYSLENTLYDVARSGDVSLKLVYLGLVYGRKGFDFHEVFMDIWSNKFSLPSPPSSSSASDAAIVGHIHHDRFLSLIKDVILRPDEYSSIIPAFDCNVRSLVDIFVSCNSKVNPDSSPMATNEPNSLSAVLEAGKCSSNVAAFVSTLQSSKHNFDKQSNLENQWAEMWAEFVSSNGLRPVKCFVAGPPKSGKTDHAKGMAERLQLKYVDSYSAVMHVLTRSQPASVPSDESVIVDSHAEKLKQLRTSLIGAIDTKLAEGTKPSKDKNAPPKTIVGSDGVVDVTQINPAVVAAAISGEFQRQCIKVLLQEDVMCYRRGYVLDVWDNEALRPVHEYLLDADNVEVPVLDVIFEIKSDDKIMVQQLQDSYGAGFAKNKEGQAAVKALDASLTAYSSGLTAFDLPQTVASNGDSSAEDAEADIGRVVYKTLQVHNIVKAIMAPSSASRITLLQRDITEGAIVGVAGNSLRVQDVCDEVLRIRSDALGWCRSNLTTSLKASQEPSPALVDVTTVENTKNPDVLPSSESKDKTKELDMSRMKGLQAMNDFLTNTVLPVLANGMIQAVRNDIHDPIAFLADFLLAESAERQARCEEQARQNFEDLLSNY